MIRTRPEQTQETARKLLAGLWERNLPVLHDRIAELSAAVAAARESSLTTEARESACGTAHKLAGSLGMFGYPAGTDAARRIEQQLDGNGPVDVAALELNIAALSAALPLESRG